METTRYFFGEWKDDSKPLTLDDVAELMRVAETKRRAFADYPYDKIMRVMGKVSALWADPAYPRRKLLEEKLPAETGFSAPMLYEGIKELCWVMDPTVLSKKVQTELGSTYATSPTWFPLGTILHILSGNVFLVGAGSLAEGLLTKNLTILKMSSGEKIFLPQLIGSFLEVDKEGVVAGSVALIDYPSSAKEIIADLKKKVDGIVVWGGEEAVKAYRNDLPARTRLIMFGPKLSIAAVTEAGLKAQGTQKIAEKLAMEIAIWDQNACTAPQLCYVEKESNARELVEALAVELVKRNEVWPAGPADTDTAVEITKVRGIFEIAEARGKSLLKESPNGVDWTVALDHDKTIEPSPLHRTLRVVPFEKAREVFEEVEKLRGYMQTIGLAASPGECLEWSREMGLSGALRLVELGQMSGGEVDDPHDGAYDLPQLVNFAVTRLPLPSQGHYFDFLSPAKRADVVNERLRVLVDNARKSPFYGERLSGVEIETTEDLVKLPPLTRDNMDANMPPKGKGLGTGPFHGGYVTRSGGSTGEPKFSIYDARDWDISMEESVRVFQAAGLARGDRLANCMLAGDLYGSFVSFDHINCRVGVTTFAFAGHVNPENFLDIWRKFDINAIQAIPTVLVPLLRVCNQLDPAFKMEKILYAGAPLSKSDNEWIRTNLGTKRISSIIGANDGNQLAFQCEQMSGALHHLIDDYNYVEVVDEAYKRVPDGTPGKLIITSLRKYAFPLIRYELGDAGRIVPGSCPCGRTSRVLEYLGRSDDSVCIGNMNIRYRDFAAALSDVKVSAMQLAAQNCLTGEYLTLRVETDEGPSVKERIQKLAMQVEKIEEHVKDGSLLRIDVDVFTPGSLPRNPRTGKIKQLVDERR